MTVAEGVDLADRKTYPTGWSLLMEWWCVPVDMSTIEEQEFLKKLRTKLGDNFVPCPIEYIRDRLYGGFLCSDCEHRRHVAFNTGQYSYTGAQHGEFRPLDSSERIEQWELLREPNEWIGEGPFVGDSNVDSAPAAPCGEDEGRSCSGPSHDTP